MMNRRALISATVSGFLAMPSVGVAQTISKTYRIGVLGFSPPDPTWTGWTAFIEDLRQRGYVEGRNLVFEERHFGGSPDRVNELAAELVALRPELILTTGGMVAALAARRATSTIPIVMAGAADPVLRGLAASLAHPGGNVTGETFLLSDLFVKRIEMLKQVRPEMTRVGALLLRGSSFNQFLPVLEAKVKALGLALAAVEIADPADCDSALSHDPGSSIGGLMVTDIPQFTVGPGAATIAAAATRHGLPAAGPVPFAGHGGLLSYGVDLIPMQRRAATFVDKILKGAKPGDIPIEQATKFVTIVNLKTARALGLEIPATVLAAADEVIE